MASDRFRYVLPLIGLGAPVLALAFVFNEELMDLARVGIHTASASGPSFTPSGAQESNVVMSLLVKDPGAIAERIEMTTVRGYYEIEDNQKKLWEGAKASGDAACLADEMARIDALQQELADKAAALSAALRDPRTRLTELELRERLEELNSIKGKIEGELSRMQSAIHHPAMCS